MAKQFKFKEEDLEFSDQVAEEQLHSLIFRNGWSENISELHKDKYGLENFFVSNTELDPVKVRDIDEKRKYINAEEIKDRIEKGK